MRAHAPPSRWYRYETLEVNALQGRLGTLLRPVLATLLLLGGLLAFVWFRSTTETLHQELVELRRENQLRRKELANLQVTLESYKSGRYISQAVQTFDLQLRPPYPGQVRRVSLDIPAPAGSEDAADTLLAHRPAGQINRDLNRQSLR